MDIFSVRALQAVCLTAACTTMSCPLSAVTGNELFDMCSGDSIEQEAMCAAYLQGVIDSQFAAYFLRSTNPDVYPEMRYFCVPEKATTEQVRDVVLNQLRDTPEIRHGHAGMLVTLALAKAFPCDPPWPTKYHPDTP